jgi:hypothetical protein
MSPVVGERLFARVTLSAAVRRPVLPSGKIAASFFLASNPWLCRDLPSPL